MAFYALLNTGGTSTNSANLIAPVTPSGSGEIQYDAAIHDSGGIGATLVNSGIVINNGARSSSYSSTGSGVYFASPGGTLINDTTGFIHGYRWSVFGASTVLNTGTITGGKANVIANSTVVRNGATDATSALITGSFTTDTVNNLGTILGFVYNIGSGGITNGSSLSNAALIRGNPAAPFAVSSSHSIVNYGTIEGINTAFGGAYVAVQGYSGATITNMAGAIIRGAKGIGATNSGALPLRPTVIVNQGTVIGTVSAGVQVDAAGYQATGASITNGATDNATATIAGIALGIATGGDVTTTNYGVITATGATGVGISAAGAGNNVTNAATGTISGVRNGFIQNFGGAVTLSNAGHVTASGTAGIAINVYSYGASTNTSITNSGTISAVGGDAALGVKMAGNLTNLTGGVVEGASRAILPFGATITNSGSIQATGTAGIGIYSFAGGTVTNLAGGVISGPSEGVHFRSDINALRSVVNYGVITGGVGIDNASNRMAVVTGGTITGTSGTAVTSAGGLYLTLLPGYHFNGTVIASTAGNAEARLRLGSAADTGTITGIGSEFQNFKYLGILPGAHWVLTGNNDLSHLSVTGQFTINNGALNVSPGTTLTAQGTIATQGPAATIVNQGTIATVYATDLQVDAPIINTGTITAIADSTLHITGTITSGDTASTGRIDLGHGAVAEFSAGLDASQTIGFGTANEVSQATVSDLADFQAAMADFGIGDSVDITGVTADFGDIADSTSGSLSASHGLFSSAQILPPAKMLRISNNGTILKQIPLTGTGTAPFVTLQPDGHGGTLLTGAAVACFAQGTRIDTPTGEIPIEHLRPGDKVISAFGGAVEIVWLGHRHVIAAAHATPADVWPIRIHAHALAAGVPLRDVLLSPEHAVHVNHHLVPARLLVNGTTIVQDPVAAITYWHVELPQHDVIFANGLPAESYLDTGNRRAAFNTGAPPPEDDPNTIWQSRACLPQLRTGPRLAAIRARLQPSAP